MTESMSLLRVESLRVVIHAQTGLVEAVTDLSFTVESGETLALVGETGSGKSMSILALTGLIPVGVAATITGRAMFEGRDLLCTSETQLRAMRGRRIGMVFQDPAQALNPLMTVGRQIAEAVAAAGGPKGLEIQLLDEVELGAVPGISRRYPHQLSGGQQQRVMIAIALAGDPSLLIADEPTTALDVAVEARILDLLARLKARRSMAMIIVSHDLGVVKRIADRMIVLRNGRAVEVGDTTAVLTTPKTAYTRALMACRPTLEDSVARLPTLGVPSPPIIEKRAIQSSRVLLGIHDLQVSYPGVGTLAKPVMAVKGVSFEIREGEALGILGESGSGKSSIARSIVGLVRPSSGEIRFDGAVLADTGRLDRSLRRRIQYIFQDPFGALNPRLTVAQLVREPMLIHDVPANETTIIGLLEEVGLNSGHLSRLPRELSGGQRQRVTIARALALEPELLICDEIVSALDVSVQAQVLNLLKDIQARRSLTLMFISHDIPVVRHMCDRIAVMQDGLLIEIGARDCIIQQPSTAYTREMIALLKR